MMTFKPLQLAIAVAISTALIAPAVQAAPGPDIMVCDLDSVMTWGSVDNVWAYSIANTKGNAGDTNLDWDPNTDQHPISFQNMYRLMDGRMEQIGMGWGLHGICALQFTDCLTCEGAGGCLFILLPGCSNPNSGPIMGYQPQLGPHWQVNAFTGEFSFPIAEADIQVDDIIRQRLQIAGEDLDARLNPGAQYFGEIYMVHPGDGAAGNQLNNASYRPVTFGVAPGYTASIQGTATVGQPAIQAWQDLDPEVQRNAVEIPDEGTLLLYYKSTDNQNGTWHYEYALFNANSDRSARSLSIPIGSGVTLSNIEFHDVDYHSGDGINGIDFDSTDWAVSQTANDVQWFTSTYEANPNANALRFGTTYNFRFDANAPPVPASADVGLFKSGGAMSVAVATVGPTTNCSADLDNDGTIGVTDLLDLLATWGACPQCNTDLDGDGVVGVMDLLALLAAWGDCP